jgi:hypothetical protein
MKTLLCATEDRSEALDAYRKYVESKGLYARIVRRTVLYARIEGQALPSGSVIYEVYGYDEECRLGKYVPGMTHDGLRVLASAYLNTTKLRAALDLMSDHPSAPEVVYSIIEDIAKDKKRMLERAEDIVENHPVYRWCKMVSAGRGSLGAQMALMFLGFIDPHEADSGGKAKAYWGLTEASKLRSGKKAVGNPRLKGVAIFAASRVIMGKDSYYYPLYQAKKEYYRNVRGISFAHSKAQFWLAALLVSHAQQIIREAEGYQVPHHRMHIPPKSSPDEVPPEWLLEALRKGEIVERYKGRRME